MGGTNAGPFDTFKTTIWEDVAKVQDSSDTIRNNALSELIVRYLPALRAHLVVKKRVEQDQADDVLQEFVKQVVLERDLFSKADESKGKLRSLIVRSLENHLKDFFRKQNRHSAADIDSVEQPSDIDRPNFIDVAWARQVLEETTSLVRKDCHEKGQESIWGVFQARLLSPMKLGQKPVAYDTLCETYDFDSPRQAENALISAKRKFIKYFNDVIKQYLTEDYELQDAVKELKTILGHANIADWNDVSKGWPAAEASDSYLRDSIDGLNPNSINYALDGHEGTAHWDENDLDQILQHILSTSPERLGIFEFEVSPEELNDRTLTEIFHNPTSSIKILNAIKRFGRDQAQKDVRDFPPSIGSVIYFAAIASALVYQKEKISSSEDQILCFGLANTKKWNWVDQKTNDLIDLAIQRLSNNLAK